MHYDFCEIPPATLSGFVFQDGPPIPLEFAGQVPDVLALRDGKLTPDDTRLAGVVLMLRDGVTGVPILGSAALAGSLCGRSADHHRDRRQRPLRVRRAAAGRLRRLRRQAERLPDRHRHGRLAGRRRDQPLRARSTRRCSINWSQPPRTTPSCAIRLDRPEAIRPTTTSAW